jgi:hypothetical protein
MKKLIMKILAVAVLVSASFTAQADPAAFQFSFFDFNAPNNNEVTGVRFPAIYGKAGGDVVGVDFGLLAFSEMQSLKGVAIPLPFGANKISGDMTGVAFGIVNLHEGSDTGVDVAIVNINNNLKGVALGAVNIAENLQGVQLGLVNCAKNGFLPCFIFFNFGTN